MSGNDEDQNIINGEIPKVSRYNYKKQGTNYSRNKNNKETLMKMYGFKSSDEFDSHHDKQKSHHTIRFY